MPAPDGVAKSILGEHARSLPVSVTGWIMLLLCIPQRISGFYDGRVVNGGMGLRGPHVAPQRTWDGKHKGCEVRRRSYVYLKPGVTFDQLQDPNMHVFLHGTSRDNQKSIVKNGFRASSKKDEALKHGRGIYGSAALYKAAKYSQYWNSVDCFWSEGKNSTWLICGFKERPGKRLVDAFDPMFKKWRASQQLKDHWRLGKKGNGMGEYFKNNTDVGAIVDTSPGVDGEDIIVFDEKDVVVLGVLVVTKPLTRQKANATKAEIKQLRPREGFMHFFDHVKPDAPAVQTQAGGERARDPRMEVEGKRFFVDKDECIVYKGPMDIASPEGRIFKGCYFYDVGAPEPTEDNYEEVCDWAGIDEIQQGVSQYNTKKQKQTGSKAQSYSKACKLTAAKRVRDGEGRFASKPSKKPSSLKKKTVAKPKAAAMKKKLRSMKKK